MISDQEFEEMKKLTKEAADRQWGSFVDKMRAGLVQQVVWIPVEERLPEDKQTCLVATGQGFVDFMTWWGGEWNVVNAKSPLLGLRCEKGLVTHWAELPQAPKARMGYPEEFPPVMEDARPKDRDEMKEAVVKQAKEELVLEAASLMTKEDVRKYLGLSKVGEKDKPIVTAKQNPFYKDQP